MAAKTQIPIDEYLRMSFDGPDREYIQGEIVERNVGETQHSLVQRQLILLFYLLSQRTSRLFLAMPELRLRLGAEVCLIPDVAVYLDRAPADPVPTDPPYLAIEILSPDDRMKAVREKMEAYLRWGAAHVWLIDPYTKSLYEMTDRGLGEVRVFGLPEHGIEVGADDIFVADRE
jgi:Uma2 family endonuclease